MSSFTSHDDSTDIAVDSAVHAVIDANAAEHPQPIRIAYAGGRITFDGYDYCKHAAEQVRDTLQVMPVDPASEQAVKHKVAQARRISDTLNSRRIEIKKEVLEPYNALETQIREITSIISEGEDIARSKLKEIDDCRKTEKENEIRTIWDKRKDHFTAGKYLSFESFLNTDGFLNKSYEMSKVEQAMVDFLTRSSKDLDFLLSKPYGQEYIVEYQQCLSATDAMKTVDDRHACISNNAAITANGNDRSAAPEKYMIVRITGKADVALAKQFLADNVRYEILEEN